MEIIRLGISALLLLLLIWVVLMNWGCVILSSRNHKRGIDKFHSTAPLVSIAMAGLACLIYPYSPKAWIWILPLVDIGTWQVFVGLPYALIREALAQESEGDAEGS